MLKPIKINIKTITELFWASSVNENFVRNCFGPVPYGYGTVSQQIKKSEFDQLFYGVFFSDLIVIFKIEPNQIGDNVKYSDKQHRGNTGEGQFHLNNKNIQYHLKNHLYKYISYNELNEWLQ